MLPKLTLREFLYQNMVNEGVDYTIKNVDTLLKTNGYKIQSDQDLNGFGYELLGEDKIDMAIEIFKLNTRLFPNVANTYDSLGEAYMANSNKQLAIKCYEKVLEIEPDNESAKSILKKLKEKINY